MLLSLRKDGLTSLYKEVRAFKVSLVRTFLLDPGSQSEIGRLGGWGWTNDPEKKRNGMSVNKPIHAMYTAKNT